MLKQLDRWSRRAVFSMLLLLPAILYVAANLPVGSASVHEWLPDGRVERIRYEEFMREFGSDQFMLISWEGCKVNDPRVAAFVERMANETDSGQAYLTQIQTTRQVIETLTREPIGLSVGAAVRRLQGTLVGRDGLCAVVAKVTAYGLKHQAQAMEHVYRAADAVEGLGRERLRMAGTIYEAHAVDVAAETSLKQLVIPSMTLGIVLACVCLRSPLAAIAVLFIAGIGTMLAVTVVSLTGGHFSAVLIVLPTLVFMLTLSSAVHLMHYYVDVSLTHKDHLGSRAMLMGFKPSLLSSVTTALGMASLMASQLAPVREFGMYSALSLCIATAFLLISFPTLSDWFYARKALAVARKKQEMNEAALSTDSAKVSKNAEKSPQTQVASATATSCCC